MAVFALLLGIDNMFLSVNSNNGALQPVSPLNGEFPFLACHVEPPLDIQSIPTVFNDVRMI